MACSQDIFGGGGCRDNDDDDEVAASDEIEDLASILQAGAAHFFDIFDEK